MCHNEHINIAKWLQDILPYYYEVNIINNIIKNWRVIPVKERKWLQLRIIVMAYYNIVTIFSKLPKDIIIYICMYVI